MNQICKTVLLGISFLFILYLVFYSIYFLFVIIRESFALQRFQKMKRFRNRLTHDYLIPVSILLTTYNDEKKIIGAVRCLLSLDYKLYEIVIIDDGSTDQTVPLLIQNFKLKKVEKPIRRKLQTKEILEVYQTQNEKIKITLLKKVHGGVADSFNAGINASEYPYFVCMNTNYSLHENSLQNLVRPILEDEHVGACNGIIRVGNIKPYGEKKSKFEFPKGILRKAQVLEYNQFSFLSKNHNEDFGLPSFVLFRKDIVISVLGFDKDAVGENFELMRKVKEYAIVNQENCIIKHAPDAVLFMDVPKSIWAFVRQRRNWNRGLSKNIRRYKKEVSFRSSLHEFYLPFIELIGLGSLLLSCILNLIHIPMIFLFIISFVLFCSTLSLCIFLFKLWTEETTLSFVGSLAAILAAIIETSLLKTLEFFAKIISFFGKSKNTL